MAKKKASAQPVDPKPFVIPSLEILRMATACLSAQEISDALEREGTIHPDEMGSALSTIHEITTKARR